MLRHYFRIAFRNLAKYKTQTIISIVGLAVGFTCFAASVLWIQYETTYDSFHPDADRIYFVRNESLSFDSGLLPVTPYPLAGYLQTTFPEVESATNASFWPTTITYNDHEYEIGLLRVDSSFIQLFPFQISKGSTGFMVHNSSEIAITSELATRLFGKEDPIGKNLSISGQNKAICAIVEKWPAHSNMNFDVLISNSKGAWFAAGFDTFIKLHKNTDVKAFEQKLYAHVINQDNIEYKQMVLTPLMAKRYDRPYEKLLVDYDYIRVFALVGGFVILCVLINYLMLFLNRLRMRGKEIGLRVACGSSNTDLMALIAVEFLITLLCAVFLGMVFFELILPPFRELSGVQADRTIVFLEVFSYAGGVMLLTFLCSLIPIHYYQRQTLNGLIGKSAEGIHKNRFGRGSLVLQLAISICFAFCALVMICQMHYLMHSNRVVERAGRGSLQIYSSIEAVREELKQLPTVTEVLSKNYQGFFPYLSAMSQSIRQWDDAPAGSEFRMDFITTDQAFFDYYGIRLREGQMLDDNPLSNQALINETAVRAFGWEQPVGKTFMKNDSTPVRVVGVVYDFCKTAPTVPFTPMAFQSQVNRTTSQILFRFQEGRWEECEKQIKALLKEKHPEVTAFRINSAEAEYAKALSSENALVKLLDFVSVVCLIISAFGSFSLIALYCEKRRKEIAIRKINGARPGEIFRLFFIEHSTLLMIATVISFPIGYLLMKAWLEQYAVQTAIHWWIYPAVFLSVAAIITACISWHIHKAAHTNPAEVLKTE